MISSINTSTKNKHSSALLTLSLSIILAGALLSTNAYTSNSEKHTEHHSDEHGDEHGSEKGHIEISADSAKKAGITSVFAKSGELKQTINVYGKSVIDPRSISQIRARFPGMITMLKLNIGDLVKKGDVIVEIESSDSLKRYKMTSPISGIITSRNANSGELASQQTLLTIANDDQLWVELQIFPSQSSKVSKGQTVTIASENKQVTSVIQHIIPSHLNKPFVIARVPLDNSMQRWSPGRLLSGSIVINQIKVPLVINNNAIQVIEGEQVIFVENENGFEVRSLSFGQTDGEYTEVLSGLQIGEKYAVKNSYLLKADLGKASASHAH